jgi:hydrogenase maturation protease
MSDDGVGVCAIGALRKKPCSGVLITEVGTCLLDAVPLICWADRVIVIDALDAGGPAGALYFGKFSEVNREQGPSSLHELDLGGALALVPRGTRVPEIHVLGIQPESLEFGLELSAAVAAAIPKIDDFVRRQLASWRQERCFSESHNIHE